MLLKRIFKPLLFVIPLAIIGYPSLAANTPPPGVFGQTFWNNGLGQYAPLIVGDGLCLSTASTGCVAPIPPAPPSGMELTADDGTTLLTADDGTTILTSD